MGKRENEGKKEKNQKKERKEKRKQYQGLYLNPLSVPRARVRVRVHAREKRRRDSCVRILPPLFGVRGGVPFSCQKPPKSNHRVKPL